MAQECGFFNAQLDGNEYDRVYLAEQFAAYFASFIGNGIFGKSMQQLEVMSQVNADMSIRVLSGQGWINGWWFRNTSDYTLSIDVADGVLSRIDNIVLRWGNKERSMWLAVEKGVPSYSPVRPELKRNADYYDLLLATVTVDKGIITISQSKIIDTRLNNDVCGLVTGVVDQIDTTDLYNQFTTYFNEFKSHYEEDYAQWTEAQKAAYLAYIANTQRLYDDWTSSKENEYATWTANKMAEYVSWVADKQQEYVQWTAAQKLAYIEWITTQKSDFDNWVTTNKNGYDAYVTAKENEFQIWYNTHTTNWNTEFETWFSNVRNRLSGDIAGSLQNQVNELKSLVESLTSMLFIGSITFLAATDAKEAIVTSSGQYIMFTQKICQCKN